MAKQSRNKKSESPVGLFITMDMDDLMTVDEKLLPLAPTVAAGNSFNAGGKQVAMAFVNLNEETGPTQDMDTRHKVRAHVMRDFQRKKHRKTDSGSGKRVLLPNDRIARAAGSSKMESLEFESQETTEIIGSADQTGTWALRRISNTSILGSLTATDPFNAMPILGSPILQSLMHYYNSVLVNTLIPVNPKDKWFNHAISDPALFQGTMMHAASHRAFVSTDHDPSTVLQLKRETIRLINERLTDPVQSTSDASIGAVTALVLLENQEGNVDLSNIHMDGLERMINLRGGLEVLGLSGVLRRKVLWADLCNANLSGREPRFAFIPETNVTFPACARIDDINKKFASFKLSQPFDSPKICACSEQFREIILDLRSISGSRKLVSNLTGELSDRIYLADRRLYTLSKNAIESPGQHSPDCAALGPSCFIAGLIYIYSSLRDFPLAVPIFEKFLERLTLFLLQNNDLLGTWNGKHQLLLWVLTTSANASIQRRWRFDLVVRLASVCAHNSVDTFERFIDQLKAVVWRDAERDTNLVNLWSEVECVMTFENLASEQQMDM